MDDKRAYFTELLQRQSKSSKSIESFCRDNSVSSGRYHYWKRKLNNQSTDKSILLVPLTIEDTIIVEHTTTPELTYPNGVTLKLRRSITQSELISFITLLD